MKKLIILFLLMYGIGVYSQTFDLDNFTRDTVNYVDENKFKQGQWEESADGNIWIGEYKDSKKHGTWHCYNDYNQKILKLEAYKDGERDGISLEFNPNGIVIKEAYYKRGLLHGSCKEYDVWDLKIDVVYIKGKIHGVKKTYYTGMAKSYEPGVTNIMEVSTYLDGLKHGVTRWYNKNDKLLAQYNYENDIMVGEQLSFYEDGVTIKTKENYKDNQLHGLSIEYYENGQIKAEGNYNMGQKVGTWKEYDEKGKLLKTNKHK